MERMRRGIVIGLEWLCGRLDKLNCLGCRIGLANWSDALDQRWGTKVWK